MRRPKALASSRDGRYNPLTEIKRCSVCEEVKPLDEFHRQASSADGRKRQCKECRRPKTRAYYEANKERILAANRQWELDNAERAAGRKRRAHYANRDAELERMREWRLANPERKRKLTRLSDARDPERVRARRRRWLERHPEQVAENNHRRRARLRGATAETKARIVELLCEPCLYCGANESVEIDHIVPLSRGGAHDVDNLAPACRMCNRSKGAKLLSEWAGPPPPLDAPSSSTSSLAIG